MAADPILIIANDSTAEAIPGAPDPDRQLSRFIVARDNPPSLVLAARTAVAAVVSYLIARLFRLPEAYWAPISTVIGMGSTLGAALPVSVQHFAGTAIGAGVGGSDCYLPPWKHLDVRHSCPSHWIAVCGFAGGEKCLPVRDHYLGDCNARDAIQQRVVNCNSPFFRSLDRDCGRPCALRSLARAAVREY
jgi:fusaric acid resistance family protein